MIEVVTSQRHLAPHAGLDSGQSGAVSPSPDVIPESVPSFSSFAHITDPRERRAKEYEQYLLFALERFPEFVARITVEIVWARTQSERTAESDRDRVLRLLETEKLTAGEVAEDLSMPRPTAYKLLRGLLDAGLVQAHERKGLTGNKPYLVYSLTHEQCVS